MSLCQYSIVFALLFVGAFGYGDNELFLPLTTLQKMHHKHNEPSCSSQKSSKSIAKTTLCTYIEMWLVIKYYQTLFLGSAIIDLAIFLCFSNPNRLNSM